MSSNQPQYHAPSPPSHGQYQSGPSPTNTQGQQYGQNAPPSQLPPQQYQQPPQQAYQGNPGQYNQYQHQSAPGQPQVPYRPQASQTNHQASSQQQSTTQVSAPGQANTPGQSTPTNSSSNQIAPGGAPARQYINETVAPYLLEGMKMLVREQPSDPLRVLGEWLIEQHQKLNDNEMLH